MICIHGKVICSGAAFGPAYVFRRKTAQNPGNRPAAASEELHRLALAISATREKLALCAERAESDTARELFDLHRMMLEDEDVLEYLRNALKRDGTTAQMAVSQTEQYFSQLFLDTGDDYMIARIDDIRDVCGALQAALSPEVPPEQLTAPAILVAEALLPGELMQLDSRNLLGIVLGSGSTYSHTAILIKEKGIPALICETIEGVEPGMAVLLDADSGKICFDPDEETVAHYRQRRTAAQENEQPFCHLPCRCYVNIGNPQEATAELLSKCDGIGLFRTEYLYFGRSSLPDEEAQFSIYRDILQRANGKNVTIRTFDIGSDKSSAALPLEKEENPALGFRGLRVYSLYPAAFKTQLRALLRAAVYGNLRIMYPMVTSEREIAAIGQVLAETARELEAENIAYRLPLQGAMIETPAAAVLSEEIAKMVDFLSVGTNDLAQYTLALDRQNGRLDAFSDPGNRAVLSLIRMAAESAHRNGIEIGICGEMASQPEWIEAWVALGIDYLSVSPASLRNRSATIL